MKFSEACNRPGACEECEYSKFRSFIRTQVPMRCKARFLRKNMKLFNRAVFSWLILTNRNLINPS